MRVVNPVGRGVSKLETGANLGDIQPRGCVCSTGSKSLAVGYNCASCACQCDNGVTNRDANHSIANTQRNYVNS